MYRKLLFLIPFLAPTGALADPAEILAIQITSYEVCGIKFPESVVRPFYEEAAKTRSHARIVEDGAIHMGIIRQKIRGKEVEFCRQMLKIFEGIPR